jgi:protein subunit release factor A
LLYKLSINVKSNEGVINNGQSRDAANTGQSRHRTLRNKNPQHNTDNKNNNTDATKTAEEEVPVSSMTPAMLMEDDDEMRAMAKEEIASGKDKLEQLELDLKKALLPKDPNDSRNIIM